MKRRAISRAAHDLETRINRHDRARHIDRAERRLAKRYRAALARAT